MDAGLAVQIVVIVVAHGSHGAKAFGVERLATTVHLSVVGLSVGLGRGVGAAPRVGGAVRVGHAASECGGGLAIRACSRVAPATVAALVLAHFRRDAHSRQVGVIVRVEAVLFNLLPPRFLGVLPLLALPPEQDAGEDEQGDDDNGDGNCNANLAPAGEASAVIGSLVDSLQACRTG